MAIDFYTAVFGARLIAPPAGNDQTCYSMGMYCPDLDAASLAE